MKTVIDPEGEQIEVNEGVAPVTMSLQTKGLARGEDWRDYLDPKKWHPAAAAYPRASDEQRALLVADIRARGLLKPIALHAGLVLDGIDRLRACAEAKVEPHFAIAKLGNRTPEQYVDAVNRVRRHLNPDQLACLAVDEDLPEIEAAAKARESKGLLQNQRASRRNPSAATGSVTAEEPKRQPAGKRGPTSSAIAAKKRGTSRERIERAKTLKAEDPERFERVKAGLERLPARQRQHQRAGHEMQPTRTRRKTRRIGEAVTNSVTEAFEDAYRGIMRVLRLKEDWITQVSVVEKTRRKWEKHGAAMIRMFAANLTCIGVTGLDGLTLKQEEVKKWRLEDD